jgi:hypothetical protein
MLDTITLTIPAVDFRLLDCDMFTPSARFIMQEPHTRIKSSIKCTCNPTKQQKAEHGYMPRLTLYKRPATTSVAITLRIEFSAPKLLYGNNFDELCDADFARVHAKLSEQLQQMRVLVPDKALENANVSAIHYSKNMPLTDYTTCSMIINEIAKSATTKRLDASKTDYRNDGSLFRFHANSHELVLYDKIKDLAAAKTSNKRAVEDDSDMQLPLLQAVFPKQFEVLRIEARLGNRTKIKSLFKKLNICAPLTFRGIFSSHIAKTVLLDYWQGITADMPVLMASGFKPEDLYRALSQQNPTAKPAEILQLVGALAIINNTGMNGLRHILEHHSTPRTWQRLKKSLQEQEINSTMRFNPLRVAEGHLQAFTPLHLDDFTVTNSTK